MNVLSGATPRARRAFFWAVRSWSLVDTRAYPVSSPVFVLNVPFIPPVTGHFYGRVLRESAGRGKTAIVIWKSWLALAPVGDRLTGGRNLGPAHRCHFPKSSARNVRSPLHYRNSSSGAGRVEQGSSGPRLIGGAVWLIRW